jgi:WD40 repeat protein
VTSVCLSPDGQTAFVGEFCHPRGSFDRPPAQVRLFDAETGKEKLDILKVVFPEVKVRDNSYGYATTWSKFVASGFVAAEFSPDGKLLALAQGGETGSGKVQIVDVETGKHLRSVSGHESGVCDVTFTADGKHVLSAGRDTMLRICQVSDGKEVGKLGKSRGGQFKDWLHAIALSADQQWIAVADIAGKVSVWKMG